MEYQASAKRQTDSACRMLAFHASRSKWHSWPSPQVGATGLSQGSVPERWLDSLPFLRLCWPLGIVRAGESTWVSFSQSRRKGFGQEAA